MDLKQTKAAAYMQKYYAESPEYRRKCAAYKVAWRAKNREWHNFTRSLKRYGLTLDQYHAKLEAQDFNCAVCDIEDPCDIDHCHRSLRVRGILCHGCNTAIGLLKESPALFQTASDYVQRWV